MSYKGNWLPGDDWTASFPRLSSDRDQRASAFVSDDVFSFTVCAVKLTR